MGMKSKIKRQPPQVQESIGAWHQEGRTLDEILDALEAAYSVEISRSALHRHIKGLDKVLERMSRSRQIAEAAVRQFGQEPESKVARANIQIMHAAIQEILAKEDEDGEEGAVAKPMDAMLLAKALEHLTKASRHDAEHILKLRQEIRKEVEAEMRVRVKALGSAKELKELSDADLEKKIAELTTSPATSPATAPAMQAG